MSQHLPIRPSKDEQPEPRLAWNRREAIQLAAASLALAGGTACTRQPPESAVPYLRQPEEVIPGRPLFFATAQILDGYAMGLLAESQTGRPIKLEGNPEHPASLGGTDAFAQAEILGLYDPNRSKNVLEGGVERSWEDFHQALKAWLAQSAEVEGEGLRILTGTVTSPSVLALIEAVKEKQPKARWHQWQTVCLDDERLAVRRAFGKDCHLRYDLAKAEVIVSFDADFLTQGPGHLRYARDFAQRRQQAWHNDGSLCRLYAAECSPSGTGSLADHRLAASPGELELIMLRLAELVGVAQSEQSQRGRSLEPLSEHVERWVGALADDLKRSQEKALVVASPFAGADLQVLAHTINWTLGSVGTTVIPTESVEVEPVQQAESLETLVHDMFAGSVRGVFILGGNPVYDSPGNIDFAGALARVPFSVRHGLYQDETSNSCSWHLPAAHFLESWGDARSWDGTLTLQQPLIAPLYDGRTERHLLSALGGKKRSDESTLRRYWQKSDLSQLKENFRRNWNRAIHDGFVKDSAFPAIEVGVDGDQAALAIRALAEVGRNRSGRKGSGRDGAVELVLRADPTIRGGEYAANGWLQELPKAMSHLTWDNALLLSPRVAEELGVQSEGLVRVDNGSDSLVVPVLVQPGQSGRTAVLHLGGGRTAAGPIGTGVGVDVGPLRSSANLWTVGEVMLSAVEGRHRLATTQGANDWQLEGRIAKDRDLVRTASVAEVRAGHTLEEAEDHQMLFPDWDYPGYSWGVTIDQSVCTGCNACVVACQAENNIPTVGKSQVLNGREMHWLRIDRYYQIGESETAVHHQPVMCMQCERAPCEVVCPVGATAHSDEGLNDMVYNRCVGTRYCSNNCPYKVRRFNFYQYADLRAPSLKLMRNPDVTVRSRGVVEKCTYCVQRINEARATSIRENRKIRDGEIVPACAQACPSRAITFGDLNDPEALVSRRKQEPHNYALLGELGTEPRTTYLAKLSDPNPDVDERERAG